MYKQRTEKAEVHRWKPRLTNWANFGDNNTLIVIVMQCLLLMELMPLCKRRIKTRKILLETQLTGMYKDNQPRQHGQSFIINLQQSPAIIKGTKHWGNNSNNDT